MKKQKQDAFEVIIAALCGLAFGGSMLLMMGVI